MSQAANRLRQRVEESIPEVWRLPAVVSDISAAVRPYLAELMVSGFSTDDAIRTATDVVVMPNIDDADIAGTIARLYAPDTVLRRMRSHANELLEPDDVRWEFFRELRQINHALDDRKLSRERGAEIRARRAMLWEQLRSSFSPEDYATSVSRPDLYSQCPDLRHIGEAAWAARQEYFQTGVADPQNPAYQALRQHLAGLVRSLPAEVREQLTMITREQAWHDMRANVGLQIRTTLAAALPPVGQAERDRREDADHSDPSRRGAGAHFWRKLPTHYSKPVGDKSPGRE